MISMAIVQMNNFFYLTGWSEPGAALLIEPPIPAGNNFPERPYTEILFLPAHNESQEQWTGTKLGPENPDASRITGFDHVDVLDNLRSDLARVLSLQSRAVYTDIPEGEQSSNSTAPLDWLKRANAFPVYVSFQDLRPLLRSLRTYKDAGEIDRIRKATDASIAAHLMAMHVAESRA